LAAVAAAGILAVAAGNPPAAVRPQAPAARACRPPRRVMGGFRGGRVDRLMVMMIDQTTSPSPPSHVPGLEEMNGRAVSVLLCVVVGMVVVFCVVSHSMCTAMCLAVATIVGVSSPCAASASRWSSRRNRIPASRVVHLPDS